MLDAVRAVCVLCLLVDWKRGGKGCDGGRMFLVRVFSVQMFLVRCVSRSDVGGVVVDFLFSSLILSLHMRIYAIGGPRHS
ncbi:unnamed protein product [Amoebophrya sp. A25]|nr:unnamed protein product [Amoebophrya sp. A25]|eukprot:GSA25T00008463001.1